MGPCGVNRKKRNYWFLRPMFVRTVFSMFRRVLSILQVMNPFFFYSVCIFFPIYCNTIIFCITTRISGWFLTASVFSRSITYACNASRRSFCRRLQLAASRRIVDRSRKKPPQLRGFGERCGSSRLGGIYSGVVRPLEVLMLEGYNRTKVRWPRW